MTDIQCIPADWPAPPRVRAFTTTRKGGVSQPPYASLNLGENCADDPANVSRNRRLLGEALELPEEPAWLEQYHSTEVVSAETARRGEKRADASYTFTSGEICVVLTADCLPVLFCDQAGTRVAAAHAGWRGLAGGVLEATVRALDCPARELFAWLGPAISAEAYEVGEDVRQAFIKVDTGAVEAFTLGCPGHYQCDMYALARQRLKRCGVTRIFGGNFCTFQDTARFYSYRRDKTTGRMASLIWLDTRLSSF